MRVGDQVLIKGFVTQFKFLQGRSLFEMELRLGFHAGRLEAGAAIAVLDRLPRIDEFETAGYTQVAAHRHIRPAALDTAGLRRMALSVWTIAGPDSLIKVIPVTPHNPALRNDDQYRPGQGVPQWRIKDPGISGIVVAALSRPHEFLSL